ncbi:MAG: c-type cytochrome [Gallionellaceae bacterium]|nr:c-type cytochrome [Gallionellaceae bacterium]
MIFHNTTSSVRRFFLGPLTMLFILLTPAAFAADLDKGKTLYLAHCSGCHGEKGFSIMPQAPNFARGESLAQPDPVLMDAIRSGSDTRPPFLGILNDREILDVISYVRTLL